MFVGREGQLQKLQAAAGAMTQGKGRVVFISGEAGVGKTYLIEHFSKAFVKKHPEVQYAYAQCPAKVGELPAEVRDAILEAVGKVDPGDGDDGAGEARVLFDESMMWRMFLSHLENSPSEDWNHAHTLIKRDRAGRDAACTRLG